MDSELFSQVLKILIPSLATLVATWFSILGAKMKLIYEEKINTQIKKDVVKTTVQYVQQIYEALNGEEKLEKAISQATLILNEKNINVSQIELRTLIEAAVYGLNSGINQKNEEV